MGKRGVIRLRSFLTLPLFRSCCFFLSFYASFLICPTPFTHAGASMVNCYPTLVINSIVAARLCYWGTCTLLSNPGATQLRLDVHRLGGVRTAFSWPIAHTCVREGGG